VTSGIQGQTDYALLTRDFIRLKTLELGYSFSDSITSKINADSIRLSVTGTNLITITDFPFDPEVVQNGINVSNTRGASGANVNNGGAYPLLKTIITGIQITF
jgi:hypothetical protein